jgi:hypothetical protein
MAQRYALVKDARVVNVVLWDGDIRAWTPPEDLEAIKIAADLYVDIGHSYEGGAFKAAPEPPDAPPTALAILAQRDALLTAAALRIDPLQDAVDLDDATSAETTSLKAWKQYRVKLSRIEQQSGFPASVVWPKAPK